MIQLLIFFIYFPKGDRFMTDDDFVELGLQQQKDNKYEEALDCFTKAIVSKNFSYVTTVFQSVYKHCPFVLEISSHFLY